MGPNRIVAIGASAGGIEALQQLASQLPSDFASPICVVVHTAPDSPGMLPTILNRSGPLPAERARDGQRLQAGHFYIAPPDYHLMVEPGVMRLTKGPRENRFRPAIDPLFRSAAQVYGPGAIGVVLSGGLDDGTAGLHAIKQLGGTAVVQHPTDALFPSMPMNAAKYVAIDFCAPTREMGAILTRLAATPVHEAARAAPADLEVEVKIAKERNPVDAGVQELGTPSSIACPECHGVLLQLGSNGILRFRCHTGHAYSAETLVAAIDDGIETALWNAVRAVEEGQILLRRLAEHMTRHDRTAADRLMRQSATVGNDAEAVRRVAIERQALDRSNA